MKISIITWDASFREKFHTVDSFCQQDYPSDQFEFIWVDFYTNTNTELKSKIEQYPNARLLNLGHSPEEQWHLGKCMNAGIEASSGDILVLPDGDVIVHKDHLNTIESELENRPEKVVFFRRWDELKDSHGTNSYTIDHLEKACKLLNATNYAGCYAMQRSAMKSINGFDESDIFEGPGAIGMETYLRLRNSGKEIKWHAKKIYHPWHTATGSSDKYTNKLITIAKHINWLNPYNGILQSWALKQRELDLSYNAKDNNMALYKKSAPTVEELEKKLPKKSFFKALKFK